MTVVEVLAIGRGVLAAITVIFALKGRYWILASLGGFGFAVSVLVSAGASPSLTAWLAYGVYLSMALHALDVTRRRRGS